MQFGSCDKETRPMPSSQRLVVLLSSLTAISFVTSIGRAENWPQWRGPRNDGISSEKNLPTKWSKAENVLWRLPLPGRGGATPCIWGDRIFLTSVGSDDNTLLLLCVSTEGKIL